MITILIADDHTVMRTGLRLVLDAEDDIEVSAESGDVDETIRKLSAHKPDVLLLDLHMPGGPTLARMDEIRAASPATSIVVLTMQDSTVFAREALRAGAIAFVTKDVDDAELLQAVRRAADGEAYLQPWMGARMASEADAVPYDGLSPRELEVLRLVALGHTNVEIAAQLFLSVRTVEAHRRHIQDKLRLRTRAELVRYALDRHLLSAEVA